jgi:hypothetical protein
MFYNVFAARSMRLRAGMTTRAQHFNQRLIAGCDACATAQEK